MEPLEDFAGFQNYIRLTLLLNEGCQLIRPIFRNEYKIAFSKEWQDSPEFGAKFIKTPIGSKCFKSSQKIQKELLKSGDITRWDITLITTVLREFPCLSIDSTTQGHIDTLRNFRNNFHHIGDVQSVSSAEFPSQWKQIAAAVLALGGSPEDISTIQYAKNLAGIEFKHHTSMSAELTAHARKLKEDGNAAVKTREFQKAITLYSKALNVMSLSDVDRGVLFSNRSHAHLSSLTPSSSDDKETEESCTAAMDDAKEVVRLRPSWWKGYARIGQIYQYKKEWWTAILFFDKVLALSPIQKEVVAARDYCRQQKRNDEINQHLDPLTMPYGRQEMLDMLKRTKEYHPSVKDLNAMNKEFMKSNDPKLRAFACVYFAHHHMHGIDVPLNYEMAALLFAKGAKEGNAEGIYNLGVLHQKGKGVARDFGRAIELFEEGASLPPFNKHLNMFDVGVSACEYALAKSYEDGTGKPIDFVQAAKWYTRASDHGCTNAPNNLGILYDDGRGVKRDQERAIQYWKLAASRRNCLAMETLAWRYLIRGDLTEAEAWYSSAVEAGSMNAIMGKSKFQDALEKTKESINGSGIKPVIVFPTGLKTNLLSFESILPPNFSNLPQSGSSSSKESVDKSRSAVNSKYESIKENLTTLTDPHRIEIVLRHRRYIKENILYGPPVPKNVRVERFTATALQKQVAPFKLSALKDITLRQMNPTKDQVYDSFVLSLIIIEEPLINHFTSIHTIVRDDNWDVQNCYFYNMKKAEKGKIGIGTRVSIMNPYFRLTKDNGSGIRVDDPQSVIFHSTGRKDVCRFCGKMGVKESCVKCKWATYCDKECQTQDWKALKHKHVCHPNLHKYL